MKNKKPNAEVVWTQLEDLLVPRLSVIDRAIYSHLLRHSRLEGKLCLRFRFDGWRAISGYPRDRCAVRCADSWPKALCVWFNAAKRGTWWGCGRPRRFALKS